MSTARLQVLVIRLGALGDLVHMSPSLRLVAEHFDNIDLHVVTREPYASALLPHMVGPASVWAWPKSAFGVVALLRRLHADTSRYDVVVNLHPSLKTNLLAILLAPTHGVFTYKKQKQLSQGDTELHAIQDFYRPFASALPLPALSSLPWDALIPRLKPVVLDTEGEAHLSALLAPLDDPRPLVAAIIGVGGKRANRVWPLVHWESLISQLVGHANTRVVLVGGADEQEPAMRLMAALPDETRAAVINACGKLPLATTTALLGRVALTVGGDTGPLHLAAAAGSPVVGLFGPTSIKRTGAVGPHAIRLLTADTTVLDCIPCRQKRCPLVGELHEACMRKLSPERVYEACQALL